MKAIVEDFVRCAGPDCPNWIEPRREGVTRGRLRRYCSRICKCRATNAKMRAERGLAPPRERDEKDRVTAAILRSLGRGYDPELDGPARDTKPDYEFPALRPAFRGAF